MKKACVLKRVRNALIKHLSPLALHKDQALSLFSSKENPDFQSKQKQLLPDKEQENLQLISQKSAHPADSAHPLLHPLVTLFSQFKNERIALFKFLGRQAYLSSEKTSKQISTTTQGVMVDEKAE